MFPYPQIIQVGLRPFRLETSVITCGSPHGPGRLKSLRRASASSISALGKACQLCGKRWKKWDDFAMENGHL